MVTEVYAPPETGRRHLLSILKTDRGRQLLTILYQSTTPLTRRDLAVQLSAGEQDKPPSAVTDTERTQLSVALQHHYLPKLEQIGLIRQHSEGVVPTERLSRANPALLSPALKDASWDVLAVVLAYPCRQRIVSMVTTQRGPLELEAIATELATDASAKPCCHGDMPQRKLLLHHRDLPALDDVGLIDYNSEEQTVTPGGAVSSSIFK